MTTTIELFDIRISIESDDTAAGWIRHDYGAYVSTTSSGPHWKFLLRHGDYDRRNLPEAKASTYHDDYIVYDSPGLRIIDFLAGGISLFKTDSREVECHCNDRDRLYEIFTMAFESIIGEELDKNGLHRIHCLALEKSGQAHILLLPPGAGKTTLALRFLEKGQVQVLTEDILLYRRGRFMGLKLAWGASDSRYSDRGRLVKKYGRRDKYLIDASRLSLAEEAEAGSLILGRRVCSAASRIIPTSRLKLMLPLFKSMVLGLELQQSLAYFLLRNHRDFFAKGKIGFGRLGAMLSIMLRSRTYMFEIGYDIDANFRTLYGFADKPPSQRRSPYLKAMLFGRKVFLKLGRSGASRIIGASAYKLGLRSALKTIGRKLPEVVAIYTTTDMDCDYFQPGQSDIDLVVVLNAESHAEELAILKRFTQTAKEIRERLPFIQHICPYFEDQAAWEEKLRNRLIAKKPSHHWSTMRLLHGRDIRKLKSPGMEASPADMRSYYEDICQNVFELWKNEHRYCRNLYKNVMYLARMLFITELKREPLDDHETIGRLEALGFSPELCQELRRLKKNGFFGNKETLSLCLFNSIKLIGIFSKKTREPAGSHDISIITGEPEKLSADPSELLGLIYKSGIRSIFLTHSPFGFKTDFIYIILDAELDYPDFKKLLESNLDRMDLLQPAFEEFFFKGVLSGRKPYLPYAVPLLMTETMLNFSEFMDGGTMEGFNLKHRGCRLYGAELPNIPLAGRTFNSQTPLYALSPGHNGLPGFLKLQARQLMAERLLKEKNIACFDSVEECYDREFADRPHNGNYEVEYGFFRRLSRQIIERRLAEKDRTG